uniref:Tc1-like transposase DDE domain-containing protein n=1 Tax=Hippocampus comes TaxID=109280 RepID=A0A3Q2YQR1_HIPCM
MGRSQMEAATKLRVPNFIFMDDNAAAHRGRIIREWLLEAGVPQIQCRRGEARICALQNLNDLMASLQEEWDGMPQQTISRLVNSMRRHCQAVIDAKGHVMSY